MPSLINRPFDIAVQSDEEGYSMLDVERGNDGRVKKRVPSGPAMARCADLRSSCSGQSCRWPMVVL